MKAETKLLLKRLFIILAPMLLILGVALLVTAGGFSFSVGDTVQDSGVSEAGSSYNGEGCRGKGRHP